MVYKSQLKNAAFLMKQKMRDLSNRISPDLHDGMAGSQFEKIVNDEVEKIMSEVAEETGIDWQELQDRFDN